MKSSQIIILRRDPEIGRYAMRRMGENNSLEKLEIHILSECGVFKMPIQNRLECGTEME